MGERKMKVPSATSGNDGAAPAALSGDDEGKDPVFGFFGKLMEITGGTFKLEVHDILANDDHSITVVRATAERPGKKLDSKPAHVTHPDSEGRVKEFWAFDEDQGTTDEFYSQTVRATVRRDWRPLASDRDRCRLVEPLVRAKAERPR